MSALLRSAGDWPSFADMNAPTRFFVGGLVITSTAAATYVAVQRVARWRREKFLRVAIVAARIKRDDEIHTLEQFLSTTKLDDAKREHILSLSVNDLLAALSEEKISASEVLHAYQLKAIEAHRRTNCLTGVIDKAEEWASQLDKQYKGVPKPPLFGLPISLKGQMRVKGCLAHRGYAQDILAAFSHEDAVMVTTLRSLGAVPFVFTNVPQSMLSFSSSNPVYGLTTNPYDASRTAGGSSSGEAALIACGGSCLGVGSDVAGSIRLPAHYCGIVGLKPTALRMSVVGFLPSSVGRPYAAGTCGPMATDVDALATFMKAIYGSMLFDLDPYVVPLPFQSEVYTSTRQLTIGWYDNNGWTDATEPCKRAVHEAKRALEKRGHRLVPFVPPDVGRAMRLLSLALSIDSGKYLMNLLGRDILDVNHRPLYNFYSRPLWLKSIWALIERVRGHPRTASMLTTQTHSSLRVREAYEQIEAYRRDFARSMQGIDCLLTPASATTALQPSDPPQVLFFPYSYTAVFNLLDFPAGVVPVTTVTPEDVRKTMSEYVEREPPERLMKSRVTGSEGLPVGVQVVAVPFREELCLRVMREIEESVKLA